MMSVVAKELETDEVGILQFSALVIVLSSSAIKCHNLLIVLN
jgi:hypothetical protein